MKKTIRLGFVGAGLIATQHIAAIKVHPNAKAVALTSRTRNTADAFAAEHGIPAVYDTLEEMVKTADLDGLMIMVSPEHMFTVGQEALKYGLPVFMEKPAGLTPEQTRALIAIADDNNVPTMVGYNRRFYSIFHKGLEIINDHGPLYGILVEGHERMGGIHACGRFSEDAIKNWIYVNGTHTIDLLRFFGGEISEVKSVGSRWNEPGGDQFSAAIEFKNGAIGTYVSNWLSPGGWRVVLYGKGVSVEYNPLEKGIWTNSKFETREILPAKEDLDVKPGFYNQMDCFCRLISNEEASPFKQDLHGALRTMDLAAAIAANVKDRK